MLWLVSRCLLGSLAGTSAQRSWCGWLQNASAVTSEKAKDANAKFWDALHGGRYEQLPGVIKSLTAAYLENPRDVDTTAHLGFAHIWAFAERARLDRSTASMADHIVLARKYFAEAVRLAPHDERIKGFLASLELAEAAMDGDEKLTRKGYFDLMRAAKAWPEFNLFTAGYALSQLPFTDAIYAQAVDLQWQNVDACAGEKVNRRTAQYEQVHGARDEDWTQNASAGTHGSRPHNFEGILPQHGRHARKAGRPDYCAACIRECQAVKDIPGMAI